MSASLGGLLKDYRLQKNLSQLEIAFVLGWKDAARLSRIEQGRVDKPSRELIDKICNAIELKEQARNELLLAGAYRPTEDEIAVIRKETNILISQWPYSAVLYDFSWRIIHFNQAVIHLYKIDEATEEFIKKTHPNLLEIVFDVNFTQNKNFQGKEKKDWHEFLLKFLLRFQYTQRARTKEKWYIDLIRRLMDNDLFRAIWLKSQNADPLIVYNFGQVTPIMNPLDKNKRLSVYFSMVPLLRDPRFEFDFDTPGDITTFQYFKSAK